MKFFHRCDEFEVTQKESILYGPQNMGHRIWLNWSGTYRFGHEQSPFGQEQDLFAHPMQLSHTKISFKFHRAYRFDRSLFCWTSNIFRGKLFITCFETTSVEARTSIFSSIACWWAAYCIAFLALWDCAIVTKFHFCYFSFSF